MREKMNITYSASNSEGICFFSEKHKGYLSYSTVDESGEIKAEWTTVEKYDKERFSKEDSKEDDFNIFLLLIPLVIIIFSTVLVVLTFKKSIWLSMRILLIAAVLVLISLFLIKYFALRKTNAFKFHAAEHMALNAYRALNRVPSLEEIYNYSPISNSCGINFTSGCIVMFLLDSFCTFISNYFIEIILLLSVTPIIIFLSNHGFLNFLQKFTIDEPTEKDLMVAIEGMNVWVKNEKSEISS